nr:hypothetical protein [Kibdelosporangium sp. MJ126-NF4]
MAFAGYLPRGHPRRRDLPIGAPLAELPECSVICTSSVRRTTQLRLRHPRLRSEALRGNVKICLMHLDEGYFDVLTAAVSELHRVDQSDQITEVLSPEAMCPPIGAGIIAL